MKKTDGENSIKKPVMQNIKKDELKNYYRFMQENVNFVFYNNLFLTGDELFELPEDLCEVKGLKILRAGIHLGSLKKNRFEPNHALAMALFSSDFKSAANLDSSHREIYDYLMGNVINKKIQDGWCGVLVDGYPIGWGKASNNIIKNHYPKGLRWNSIT
jgi:NOL1/NOP2/fmu family ribosome biogenesis protein